MFLSDKTPLLAVDIGSSSIKLAQLQGSGKRYELTAFGVMPLEPDAITDGIVRDEEQVADALTRLIRAEKVETRYAVASLSGESVIIKKIQMPLMPDDELTESITQEAEQYIPFDIDDVRLDYQKLGMSGGGGEFEDLEEDKQDILLVAVQNDLIDNRADVLQAAGLKPVIIDLDVFAMSNALAVQRDLETMGGVAVVDLGNAFTHVNLLLDGVSFFTRDIPTGGRVLTNQLGKEFRLEYNETEGLKQGIIPESVDRQAVIDMIVDSFDPIIDELQKSFELFSSTSNSTVEQVFVCGGGALIPGVDNLLSDRLAVPVEIFNPLETIKINPRKFDRDSISQMAPLASVVAGLATRRFDYL
ncbi:MAG: type IV pilus assembly protein PilM [Nitrospina sp.]|nr:type IV pilus assembly protein PilM [Nitrospina sp.]